MDNKRVHNWWFPYIIMAIIAIGLIGGTISNNILTHRQLRILKSSKKISQFEMEISQGYDTKVRNILVSDRETLDSISRALRTAIETPGEGLPANINIYCTAYKEDEKVEFRISYNVYHGWKVDLGAQLIKSDYMIHFVKAYVDTTKYSK